MSQVKRRLFVVLGMHRSGTSTVTRGLEVMGISLGNNLMPSKADNKKGFFEDSDINHLNIELLSFLQEDWHTLKPILPDAVARLVSAGYVSKSVNLLNAKLNANPIFAFKDPRVAKLMPFWRLVFQSCDIEPSYVFVIRNPLSVADSLLKRDGIQREKSYLLWLGHVMSMLTSTSDTDLKVMVNYDALMQSPDQTLQSIANAFNLHVNKQELNIYLHEFLDQSLMHTRYGLQDLELDAKCPPIVKEVYAGLLEIIKDNTFFDFQKHARIITDWSDEYDRLYSTLNWIDNLNQEISYLLQQNHSQNMSLNRAIQLAVAYDKNIIKPLFSPNWYLQQNPDVLSAGVDAYEHCLNNGLTEGRQPFADAIYIYPQFLTNQIANANGRLEATYMLSDQIRSQLKLSEENAKQLNEKLMNENEDRLKSERVHRVQLGKAIKFQEALLEEFSITKRNLDLEILALKRDLALIAAAKVEKEKEHKLEMQEARDSKDAVIQKNMQLQIDNNRIMNELLLIKNTLFWKIYESKFNIFRIIKK